MKKAVFFSLCVLLSAICASSCFGKAKCLAAKGEAAIMKGDIPSAKLEAIATLALNNSIAVFRIYPCPQTGRCRKQGDF